MQHVAIINALAIKKLMFSSGSAVFLKGIKNVKH